MPEIIRVFFQALFVCAVSISLIGCAQIIEKPLLNFSDSLAASVLDQNDPELVREGAPAFLLLTEGFIRQSPDNEPLRSSAAQMYSLYTAAFINDPERTKKLSDTAYTHGEKAFCLSLKISPCNLNGMDFDTFTKHVSIAKLENIDALAAAATSWLVWIRANSDDWSAIAQLPKAELVLTRIVELQDDYGDGSIKMYLGILNTLRPPALGGKPDLAKRYFEEAIALSKGNNLSAKVEYAKSYARTLYDRELHDKLLNEVLQSETIANSFTMSNTLAKEEAKQLLESADDYF